jgi:hypothetical protein
MEVQWKRGEFLTFFAQMKIRIGGKDTVDIHKGDQFEYDGSVVKYAGTEFPQPGLRGAIREDWATLDPAGQGIAPTRPSRSVAKAQSSTTNLSGRVQRNSSRTVTSDSQDENTVLEVGDRDEVRDDDGRGGHLTKVHNRAGMRVSASEADGQDGVVVAGLRNQSPARSSSNVYQTSKDAIENRHRKTISQEGVTISTNMGDIDSASVSVDSDEAQIVGKVRQSTPVSEGGIKVRDTSGSPGGKVNTMAKKKNGSSSEISPKLQAAREIDPNFPENWNFFAKPDDKVAKIKELGADPKFLKALFASEGKKMKKVLQKEFPDVLA